MPKNKGVISVSKDHIAPGIKKYDGKIDLHLQNILTAAKLAYVPYAFSDGRILLVLGDKSAAFLYADEETLFNVLSLS